MSMSIYQTLALKKYHTPTSFTWEWAGGLLSIQRVDHNWSWAIYQMAEQHWPSGKTVNGDCLMQRCSSSQFGLLIFITSFVVYETEAGRGGLDPRHYDLGCWFGEGYMEAMPCHHWLQKAFLKHFALLWQPSPSSNKKNQEFLSASLC